MNAAQDNNRLRGFFLRINIPLRRFRAIPTPAVSPVRAFDMTHHVMDSLAGPLNGGPVKTSRSTRAVSFAFLIFCLLQAPGVLFSQDRDGEDSSIDGTLTVALGCDPAEGIVQSDYSLEEKRTG